MLVFVYILPMAAFMLQRQNSCTKDHMAHKGEHIDYLDLYRKSLPTSGLDDVIII